MPLKGVDKALEAVCRYSSPTSVSYHASVSQWIHCSYRISLCPWWWWYGGGGIVGRESLRIPGQNLQTRRDILDQGIYLIKTWSHGSGTPDSSLNSLKSLGSASLSANPAPVLPHLPRNFSHANQKAAEKKSLTRGPTLQEEDDSRSLTD